jgi:hypothetical protein
VTAALAARSWLPTEPSVNFEGYIQLRNAGEKKKNCPALKRIGRFSA